MNLIPNQKLTIVSLSTFDQATKRREIRLVQVVGSMITYHYKGNRNKQYYLNLDDSVMVFEGWALRLLVDGDTTSSQKNGQYIFISNDVPGLKRFLSKSNINRYFKMWAKLAVEPTDRSCGAKRLIESEFEITKLLNNERI